MSVLTKAVVTALAGDATLAALLATYEGAPAVFSVDPAPGDAQLPYIVTSGEVVQEPSDTKTTRGRRAWRDVRCYAPAEGSAMLVEAMAERARVLLHRQALTVVGFETEIAEVAGPFTVNEKDAYGRVLTVRFTIKET